MHKFILNNKFTNVLAAFFVFAATDAFATYDCRVVPDASEWCTEKGYTMSEDDCEGSSTLIKCPLDMSMLFCDRSELDGVKVCEFGDILYSNNQCYSVAPTSATPKAIVIDPEKRIALATKYASDTPIPYMTSVEFNNAASQDAFNPFSSVYGSNLVDDEALGENLTPFMYNALYNTSTGYMNKLSNAAFQNILGDNPNYKPFPIATNVSKLCTGEWFLPPIGVFAYGRKTSSGASAGLEAMLRFRTNDAKFMTYNGWANTYNGSFVSLWTSSFYYFSDNYPSPIAAILNQGGFTHYTPFDSDTLTPDSVKQSISQNTSFGCTCMVRCATRY